ncbi:MAG TPA: hypothetical protein VLX29_01780 [Nitrospirota bacterium]|nr:hypothetical protein [Nitrospirota bacterium]
MENRYNLPTLLMADIAVLVSFVVILICYDSSGIRQSFYSSKIARLYVNQIFI